MHSSAKVWAIVLVSLIVSARPLPQATGVEVPPPPPAQVPAPPSAPNNIYWGWKNCDNANPGYWQIYSHTVSSSWLYGNPMITTIDATNTQGPVRGGTMHFRADFGSGVTVTDVYYDYCAVNGISCPSQSGTVSTTFYLPSPSNCKNPNAKPLANVTIDVVDSRGLRMYCVNNPAYAWTIS